MISVELSITKLFLQNSQPSIVPSSFEMFMAAHSLKNKHLVGQMDSAYDYTPSNTALLLQQFLSKQQVPVLEHPLYLPDLAV